MSSTTFDNNSPRTTPPVGSAPITVTRADGVQARDAKGVGVLAFEVLKQPVERRKKRK